MDKRLSLALLLSVIVLVGWYAIFPPRPAPPSQKPAVSAPENPAAPAGEGAPAVAPPNEPALGQLVGDSVEQTLELKIGTPGARGSYYAKFSNAGALCLDLRLGDSYDQPKLEDSEKLDVAHWTHILDSVAQDGRRTGSLALRANDGLAKAFEHGTPLDRALWTMRRLGPEDAPTGVEFELQPGGGLRFKKSVRFRPGSYDIDVELSVTNEAAGNVSSANFLFTPAEVVPLESGDKFYIEPQAVAAGRDPAAANQRPQLLSKARDDRGGQVTGAFKLTVGGMSFAGVHNKYFAVLARGDAKSSATLRGATWRLLKDEAYAAAHPAEAGHAWRFVAADMLLELALPAQGETRSWTYAVYAGPKAPEALQAANPDFEALVESDLGFFATIAHFLLAVLNFFHGIVGNWGVAIILLTLSVRLVLFPINRRSQTAMARYQAKMKRVQPQIEALKKKYEKDPARLRQEQTLLMQKEGAFPPLGGCLPMFLQIPVFFALFAALRASYDLRQAPFALWMHDLAKPDQLARIDLNTHLPFIGTIEYFNLLPILMVVLWVLQQRLMPKPTDEQALKMQKMMMIMPVFMGFFLYNYAAGLSLYMITQSTLGIVEQVVIKRFWPLDMTEQPKKEGGFWSKIAKLQEEQQRKLNGPSPTKKKRP
ncbi:MAG TPA: membrane protein insertase YidC [Planctomycetota bacterium]|nr:membrane protein insertase YidC [Planctomycetota bacterium]